MPILRYILNMLPSMLFALPLILLFRFIKVKILAKRYSKTTLFHEAGICFFILFLIGLASQTVISRSFDFSMIWTLRGKVNLIPFKVFAETVREVFHNDNFSYFLINFVGNIVMFMPLGFFPPLLWNKISLKKAALIGLCSSLFIELCQLPLSRGSDIDDLWLNTLGAILGYLVFLAVKKRWPIFVNRCKVIPKEL